jgi:hypothetical protein
MTYTRKSDPYSGCGIIVLGVFLILCIALAVVLARWLP